MTLAAADSEILAQAGVMNVNAFAGRARALLLREIGAIVLEHGDIAGIRNTKLISRSSQTMTALETGVDLSTVFSSVLTSQEVFKFDVSIIPLISGIYSVKLHGEQWEKRSLLTKTQIVPTIFYTIQYPRIFAFTTVTSIASVNVELTSYGIPKIAWASSTTPTETYIDYQLLMMAIAKAATTLKIEIGESE